MRNGPDFKGFIRIDDNILGVAIWEQETRDGRTYLSIKVDDKEAEYHAQKHHLDVLEGEGDDRRDARDDRRGRRDDRDSRDERRGSRDDRDGARDRFARGGRDDDKRDTRRDDHDRSWDNKRDDRKRGYNTNDFDDQFPGD
ncbi:MAG: hypothetical protein AB7J28_16800 [Hyphomonadaceae bacterium]